MPKLLRNQAFLCSLLVAVCVIASWPFAETGMHDDWSYIRTAQGFANTGHVVFNGWGAPMRCNRAVVSRQSSTVVSLAMVNEKMPRATYSSSEIL